MVINMNKKKRLIVTVLAVIIAAGIIAGGVKVGSDINAKRQKPLEEKALTDKQRQVLMQGFEPVEPGQKKQPKRVISNTAPLNLLNYYGGEPVQTLWASIPDNQKPFTILLIIPGHTLLPGSEGALEFLEQTADTCEQNAIPYAIQNTNGEIMAEERLPVKYLEERFAARHEYFYGLNAAELYNGVTWRGECESDSSQYIIDCIELCARHGAFFLWTDTNMNYNSGMVLEWFEKNEAFYSAFKNNSEYICLMNKESYGKPSTYSCMQGLWLAGLVGNWGVASDWWHWQVDGDKKSLFGEHDELVDNEWDMIMSYPENMYVQSMMLVMSCGGTCFKAEAPNFSTSVQGTAVGGFEYGISPLLDRIIDGTLQIPSRSEVLAKTRAAVLGYANYPMFNYKLEESNLYPASGRYGIIPLLPANLRTEEIEVFNQSSVLLIDYPAGQDVYDSLYAPLEGDTYLTGTGTQWYYINNAENMRSTKSASFEPALCGASQVDISAQEHTSAIIREGDDGMYFYLSNYRTDKTQMLAALTPEYMQGKNWMEMTGAFLPLGEDGSPIGLDDTQKRTSVIKITGTFGGGQPVLEWLKPEDGTGYQNRPYTHTEQWDAGTHTLTITVEHNGIVEFNVSIDPAQKPLAQVKSPQHREVTAQQADTTRLKELVDSVQLKDKSAYSYYSYLRFNAAYEKARVLIAQATAGQKEADAAFTELENAYGELVDITKYASLLNEAQKSNMDAEQLNAFDALLREVNSSLPYVSGRSQNLTYAEFYRNKQYSADAKIRAMDKKADYLQ